MATSNIESFLNDPSGPKVYPQTQYTPSQPVKVPATRNYTSESIASSPESNSDSSSYTTSSDSILSRTVSKSSTASTAPSEANEPHQTLDQQLLNMGGPLPCLLKDMIGCGRSFRMDDFESWCSHNKTHFGTQGPPTYSRCIFCDKEPFMSADATRCWQERMLHIFDHFQQNWTLEDSRPDFEMIKDLHRKGGISDVDFHWAIMGTERPKIRGLRPLGFETKKVEAARRAKERDENQIIIKESARRRRRE